MARPQDHLPRLSPHIPQPGVNFQAQPMFSPAVQNYRPTIPLPNPTHTPPIQPFFPSQPPPSHHRPLHHPARASIAHLASIGIHPPSGFTSGPAIGGPHFPSMMGSVPGPSSTHLFPNRNRRQLSIGGPPKAVLGGPARKLSPLPPVASAVAPQKVKKVNVKLPKETIPVDQEGQPLTREPWARNLLDGFEYREQEAVPVKLTSAEVYPPDEWRFHIPDTLDVFLPGKLAWEEMKKKDIEAKLEKLGVERGYGSNVPHIHAPHARAASISSPADPQILLYKLTKLQQSQEGAVSGSNSLDTSPQLPFGGISSSPHRSLAMPHRHTMSLAHPSSHIFLDSNGTTYNPFEFSIEREVDPIPHSGHDTLRENIHAPQGCVPHVLNLLAPNVTSPPMSRPDFIRGFGLDIPEEEEGAANIAEEANEEKLDDDGDQQANQYSPAQLESYSPKTERNVDEADTALQSRFHSRHASKLSTALSTQSADALGADHFLEEKDIEMKHENSDDQENNLDEDIVNEWTGSEDVYTGEMSDGEESIGEWSNPSDEERARKERLERRNCRGASAQIDVPRRIPNFPRPPDNTVAIPTRNEDIISNPSEEETRIDLAQSEYLRRIDYYPRPFNLSGTSQPLPHSRGPSAQHTAYDPAHAHSRASSNQNAVPGTHVQTQSTESTYPPPSRHDSLNPFAKAFVFGARGDSGTWGQGSITNITLPNAPALTHMRLPSLGKPLNVAAPEFKPGRFTFRPPPGVPTMPPPQLEIPQSDVLAEDSFFRVQGREKRQRRDSTSSVQEDDSMVSFRFPADLESPKSIHHSPAAVPTHKLNLSAEPFTFAGFSAVATLPRVPREEDPTAEPEPRDASEAVEVPEANPEETYNEGSTAREEVGDDMANNEELQSAAATTKPKRAPIPLDFKHPVSSNTVPAGLFKALNSNNGDERRRNTVRSRLGSREIFEHSRRPSMDDLNVTQIANKGGRPRYVTDPGHREFSPMDDYFGKSHSRRRSSFTDAIRPLNGRLGGESENDGPDDVNSEMSLTRQLDKHSIRPFETIIKDGFVNLQSDIKQHGKTQRKMISDMQMFLKAQYAEGVTHKNQLDTRRELDLQMITDFVEQSNNNLAQILRDGLHDVRQQVWQAREGSSELVPVVEQLGNRTINAVMEALSEASTRQEAIIRSAPALERDFIIDNLVSALTPLMGSLRAEPIDYEFLTSELTQAVKPHISQLIDLASDKQETAGLIMDRLIPMLPTSNVDVDTVTEKLTAEVRRAIAPIDAFEIKEQVADLVVERLDSRLAVRDKAFNIDSLSSRIVESVSKSLEPLDAVSVSLERISRTTESRQAQISLDQERMINLVSELPNKLSDELRSLQTTQTEILSKLELPQIGSGRDQNVLVVKAAVEEISTSQKIIASQAEDLRYLHQLILDKLDTLPDSIHAATDALQNNHIDFLNSHEATKRELDELRKSNTDYQIQVSKARGAHGQIRVEKDVLSEKLVSAESERDRLRDQVKDLQASSTKNNAQVDALVTKNKELEDALAAALTRLQASDITIQGNQKCIEKLEDERLELVAEKQGLQTKVNSLELQMTTAIRDKESALQATEALQQQHNVIMAQQSHWDELRRTSEKIDILASLIDSEELKELRRYRDRTKNLEHDLQKRLGELETKIGNSERTAATVKQSLAQAQQRSSEWESRAKELEAQLEITHTKLDQTEQTRVQLNDEYSLLRLQFEEREANDRLTQDQFKKLQEQISLWENKYNRLQEEFKQAQTIQAPRPYRNITNGDTHPPTRPESRASIISIDRSATPQQNVKYSMSTARSSTPTGSGTVRDSIHAPRTDAYKYATPTQALSPVASRTPYSQPGYKLYSQAPPYRSVAPLSPTPSTVSLAPTQDKDGWWS